MLLNPVVPLSPVTVKDNIVVTDWFVEMVTLVICELVTFPLITRLTILPLSVAAGSFVGGVAVGDGVFVGVRANFGVGAGVRVTGGGFGV